MDDHPRLAAFLLAPLLVGACLWWWLDAGSVPREGRHGPVRIGAILSLTGEAGFMGDPARKVLVDRVEELNAEGGLGGQAIELVVKDSGGRPDRAVAAARELVADPALVAVIGPTLTNESVAVMPCLEKAGVPHLTLARGHKVVEPCRPWTFRVGASERHQVGFVVEWLKRHRVRSAALLASDRTSARSGLDQFEALAASQGVRTSLRRRCGVGERLEDSDAWLEAVVRSGAGALVAWGNAAESATVARMLRARRFPLPAVLALDAAGRDFIRAADDSADACLAPAPPLMLRDALPAGHPCRREIGAFRRWYEDRHHQEATPSGGQAWDALHLVVDAVRATGGNRARVRAHLEQVTGFVGCTGLIRFTPIDHDGMENDAFVMVTFRSGRMLEAP